MSGCKIWFGAAVAMIVIISAFPARAEQGSCTGGMEMTAAKKCACPSGKVWSGQACVAPASKSAAKKDDGEKRCSAPRAAGKWPDCCPVWAPNFREGKCWRAVEVKRPKRQVCADGKVIPAWRPCAGSEKTSSPAGTTTSSTEKRLSAPAKPTCPASRPAGTPPNCCRNGEKYVEGVGCRRT